jgi:hypothetical protein
VLLCNSVHGQIYCPGATAITRPFKSTAAHHSSNQSRACRAACPQVGSVHAPNVFRPTACEEQFARELCCVVLLQGTLQQSSTAHLLYSPGWACVPLAVASGRQKRGW